MNEQRLNIKQMPTAGNGSRSTTEAIVIHTTGGATITSAYNFLVRQDGTVEQYGDINDLAHHAGTNRDRNARNGLGSNLLGITVNTNPNTYSIGVGLVGTNGAHTEQQYNALLALIIHLNSQYSKKLEVISHSQLVPLHRWYCPVALENEEGGRFNLRWDAPEAAVRNMFHSSKTWFCPFTKKVNEDIARVEEEAYEELKRQTTTPKRFNTLEEIKQHAPWALGTIQSLADTGELNGNGQGLDLSMDMLRILTIVNRRWG
jgi:hypothetical protein